MLPGTVPVLYSGVYYTVTWHYTVGITVLLPVRTVGVTITIHYRALYSYYSNYYTVTVHITIGGTVGQYYCVLLRVPGVTLCNSARCVRVTMCEVLNREQ